MEDKTMTTENSNSMEFYQMIRENRMLMYSSPKRYYNRDGQQGSAFRFLFLVEVICFLLMIAAAGTTMAQTPQSSPMFTAASEQKEVNIHNYQAVYNTGKVFVSWTSKSEPEDCIYIIERSGDGARFESVGVKEGIGADIELYYSWIDQTPPAGFAYYRVKKITKEGQQLYSSVNTIINQATNFNNYAQGEEEKK
jgi:hypothetical protein